MKIKLFLIAAFLGVATMVHANSCNLFTGTSLANNSYSCSLPTSQWSGEQITSCTFTFTSCYGSGLLYCNLGNGNSDVSCGSQYSSTSSWSCTLTSDQLACLNNCVSVGNCLFNLSCYGYSYIGNCTCEYTCKNNSVPDSSATVFLLGLGLLCVEATRRKLAPAKIK